MACVLLCHRRPSSLQLMQKSRAHALSSHRSPRAVRVPLPHCGSNDPDVESRRVFPYARDEPHPASDAGPQATHHKSLSEPEMGVRLLRHERRRSMPDRRSGWARHERLLQSEPKIGAFAARGLLQEATRQSHEDPVRNGQDCSQLLQINVLSPNLMMLRHD